MTKANVETVKTLMEEVFKIKEANQETYISVDVSMHSSSDVSFNVGAIGDSGKCFVTGSLSINEYEESFMLDTIKAIVEKAKNYDENSREAKDAKILELQEEIEALREEK